MVERWNATAKELLREVQLLQRGRATIHVVENFAKFKHRIMACSWNLGYCHSMSLEMDHTIGRSARFHWRSMALSCIVSDVKRGIGRKSRFFIPHLQTTTPMKGPRRNIAIIILGKTLKWRVYHQKVKKSEDTLSCYHRIHERDRHPARQTDRQIDTAPWHRPRYAQRHGKYRATFAKVIVKNKSCTLFMAHSTKFRVVIIARCVPWNTMYNLLLMQIFVHQ